MDKKLDHPVPANAPSGDRPVRFVVAPKTTAPAPIVMVLHGYGGGADDVLPWSGLSALAELGVLVVAPDGTRDDTGRRFWNANSVCCDFEDKRPDDVAYLTGLVDDLAHRHAIDRSRVYAVGLSNGGAMAMRLACDASDVFAAVVSFAGPSEPEPACTPKRPMSVRIVHGTADPVVPFAGGPKPVRVHPNAKGVLASANAIASAWARREGCGDAVVGESLDFVPSLPGAETRVSRYASCANGVGVELLVVDGGVHVPPLGPTFAESTWQFLSAHTR